jgi:RNA polymerase sigma factor (sigma-70 family)
MGESICKSLPEAAIMAHGANLLIHHLRALVDPARQETAADGQLLARWAADHDDHAFAALVWRYGPLIWRVSRSVLAHDEDAEDTFQATFLVLARKAATLKRRKSIAGWLYETAFRLALNSRKSAARRHRREAQVCQKPGADPVEQLSVREARTILTEELRRLPAEYRDPVMLCLYQGLTQDEAAQRLGCALSTLKRRLERGRTLLAQRLTRRGLVPAVALAVTLSSRSTVSGLLVQTTITAAKDFVAGQALTGGGAALAGGLLRTLLLKKLAVCLTVMLAVGGLTLGAGVVYLPTTQTPPGKGAPAKGAPAPLQVNVKEDSPLAPRLDRDGVALPPGALNRLGSQRFRNNETVDALVFAPDGKAIASACADGSVRLWDAATGKLRWRLEAEKKQDNLLGSRAGLRHALAFNSDGKKLAMLNNGGYAVLDTVMNKILVRREWPGPAKGGEKAIGSAITADLTTLALGFRDGSIRLVDAVTGQEKMRFKAGEEVADIGIQSIEFSPDGKTIYTLEYAGSVRVFAAATGKLVDKFKSDGGQIVPKMAFSRDFHQLAIFGRGQNVKPDPKNPGKAKNPPATRLGLWDLKSGKERHVINMALVFSGAFTADGKLFAAATQKEIVILDTATGQEQRRMPHLGTAHSLAFTPDGNTLAASESGGITLRSVATGELQAPLMEPRGAIFGAKFRADGKQLLTFGTDGAYWWDVAAGHSVRHLQDVPPMLRGYHPLSPDEKIWVTRGAGGDLVLLDTATNQPVRTLKSDKLRFICAVFSPDGAKLFAAGGGTVTVWDVASGKPLMELESKDVTDLVVSDLAVSPDGRWLASWTQAGKVGLMKQQPADGTYDIHLWDVATGKLARRLTPRYGAAFQAAFSADSTRLVIVGGEPGQPGVVIGKGGKANEIQLWDVATGKELRKFQGNQERIVSVAISADGRMIATGKSRSPGSTAFGAGADTSVQLWDAATGTERGRIEGHDRVVDSMDFSPDGRCLAATSLDAPIYIWDVYALEKSQFTKVLTKEDKDKLWQQLADEDAAKAFQAVRELIARPVDAVAIFQDGWKRVPRATALQMQKWMEELDSNQFGVRQTAQVELDRYLAGHETLLATAIEKANTLEQRQRLEAVLHRLHPETLRRTRMLEVLERIGIGPARQFLQTLAEQTDDDEMSREAKAGLKRLERS